jgi:hypothetical protein
LAERGILGSSPHQRKTITVLSAFSILALFLIIVIVNLTTEETRWAKLLSDLLLALTASAMFALLSTWFLYFFRDPADIQKTILLLPEDIGKALDELAKNAGDYTLSVRTGRHFRAEVLPVLVNRAKVDKRHILIQAALLDFTDAALCERYARFRSYTTAYVQMEIIATILLLVDAVRANPFIEVDLYLSRRLSTFRMDGSSDEIIVTREDARHYATRYRREDPYYAAFLNEFKWIKDEATHEIKLSSSEDTSIGAMFPSFQFTEEQLDEAKVATSEPSPYAK